MLKTHDIFENNHYLVPDQNGVAVVGHLALALALLSQTLPQFLAWDPMSMNHLIPYRPSLSGG